MPDNTMPPSRLTNPAQHEIGKRFGSRPVRVLAVAAAISALLAGAALWRPVGVAAQAAADPAPNTPEFYTQKVVPIFQANCYRCHGGENRRGTLSLNTLSSMEKGGHDGSVITPGHPEKSLLIALIRHEGPKDDPMPMPPRGKISDAEIAVVTAWVQAGAVVPKEAQ